MATVGRSLNVHLGNLKEPWLIYCSSIGKKPGQVLKEAVEKQLALSKKDALKPVKQLVENTEPEQKRRVEILLTESEKTAVKDLAEFEGCSSRRWMTDAIRFRLTNEPQLSMPEVEMLGEANYLLLAVGRNLNQIARKVNAGLDEPELLSLIKDLRKTIDNETDSVSTLIRANVERWSIK